MSTEEPRVVTDDEVLAVVLRGAPGPQLAETVYRRGQEEGHGHGWTREVVDAALERLATAELIERCNGPGWYRATVKPEGCVDQNCALMPHGGMGVLGACKCLENIALRGAEGSRARRKVLNALRWWQAQVRRVEGELAALKRTEKS